MEFLQIALGLEIGAALGGRRNVVGRGLADFVFQIVNVGLERIHPRLQPPDNASPPDS